MRPLYCRPPCFQRRVCLPHWHVFLLLDRFVFGVIDYGLVGLPNFIFTPCPSYFFTSDFSVNCHACHSGTQCHLTTHSVTVSSFALYSSYVLSVNVSAFALCSFDVSSVNVWVVGIHLCLWISQSPNLGVAFLLFFCNVFFVGRSLS